MIYQYQSIKNPDKIIELDQLCGKALAPRGYVRVWGAYMPTEKGGKIKARYRQKCDYISPNDDSKPYKSAFGDYTK